MKTQLSSSCRSCSCRICSSLSRWRPMPALATGVAPLPVIGDFNMCFNFLHSASVAWDCSDKDQGEIPAQFAGAGSSDTCGCHPLLGGAAMVSVLAPLRASGETLGPDFWTGRRWRLSVVLPFLKASSCSLAASPTVELDASCLHCVRVTSQG